MRTLTKEECEAVSGAGAFSYAISVGLFAASATASFFVGGPAGVAATAIAFGIGTGANIIYDVSNEGRVRNEDLDAFGNKQGS